jgi:acyl-CoA reductase-like NAD-dependent aldehyde dehydrogenase
METIEYRQLGAFDDPSGWARWTPARRAEVLERFAVALEARTRPSARRSA